MDANEKSRRKLRDFIFLKLSVAVRNSGEGVLATGISAAWRP